MPMRFLLEPPAGSHMQAGDKLTLTPERSHYLCKVMRMKTGQPVPAFDGCGRTVQATLVRADSRNAIVRIDHIDGAIPPPSNGVHLGISILKGQAMDRALQQATELGAMEITPLTAQRSNVRLTPERSEKKLTHWNKIITAACEQSGRLYVPQLNPPATVGELLSGTAIEAVVLDQRGAALPAALEAAARLLLIGPEGGWNPAEIALFKSLGTTVYSLGETVLRAETVPAVALALLQHIQPSSDSCSSI